MDVSDSWVERLLSASQRLTVPAHIPGAMPGHERVRDAVAAMFTRFSPREFPRVRAWVDGGQRYTITDALVELAEDKALSLPERLAKASGSPHYCVTFNGLTGWSERFSEQMQKQMLDPLFDALGGAPVCGTDFYAFFGNYGYTPFGVHDDTDESLLWHLGPAPKIAYIWPRARYIELTGGTLATVNYEALLPHALRFELQPGDLLCIPMGDFHILDTREFSCTLGLTLFPEDRLLECTEALRMLAPDDNAMDVVARAPITLEELVNLRRIAVQSNGSVITPPQLSEVHSTELDIETLRRSTLRTRPSWPLRTVEIAGRQALFVRRRVVWGRPNALFGLLCDALAAGPVRFADFEQTLAGKVRGEAVAELVKKIASLGGVSIEQS